MSINQLSQDYEIPDERLSYSELKDRIREEITVALSKKKRIMLLAKKLEQDNLTIKDTICSQICTDFKDLISPDYIRKCLPAEYKQKSKMRTRACNTNIANDGKNVAEQIVQLSSAGEETYAAPEPKPTQEVKQLQTQLAVMTDILKKKDKEIDFLRALADDKIGPVKLPNISRVSESNKRGLQILASRFTEIVRSKLAAEANARINFYIIAKRRTGVESLVPIKLIIDMNSKTTEVILDEGRPLMVG